MNSLRSILALTLIASYVLQIICYGMQLDQSLLEDGFLCLVECSHIRSISSLQQYRYSTVFMYKYSQYKEGNCPRFHNEIIP